MEKIYLVEISEMYEDAQFDMETTSRYEALCRAGKRFSKLRDEEFFIISEWEDGVLNSDKTLKFYKIDGIQPIHEEIKREKDNNLIFMVSRPLIYEPCSASKLFVSKDKEKAFKFANDLFNEENPYQEKMVEVSVVKDLENLDKIRVSYNNKEGFNNFAKKYGIDIKEMFENKSTVKRNKI